MRSLIEAINADIEPLNEDKALDKKVYKSAVIELNKDKSFLSSFLDDERMFEGVSQLVRDLKEYEDGVDADDITFEILSNMKTSVKFK